MLRDTIETSKSVNQLEVAALLDFAGQCVGALEKKRAGDAAAGDAAAGDAAREVPRVEELGSGHGDKEEAAASSEAAAANAAANAAAAAAEAGAFDGGVDSEPEKDEQKELVRAGIRLKLLMQDCAGDAGMLAKQGQEG